MSTTSTNLSEQQISRIYAPLRSELNKLSVQDIRNTVAAAGFDVTRIPSRSEAKGGSGSRAEVMPAIDRLFAEMAPGHQLTALCILAERLMGTSQQLATTIQEILARHGFQFLDGTFVPVGLLDAREAP
ncbi:MAG: hypothetical protein ACE5HL_05275, partial [Terriglobia bacterium]